MKKLITDDELRAARLEFNNEALRQRDEWVKNHEAELKRLNLTEGEWLYQNWLNPFDPERERIITRIFTVYHDKS